MRATLLTALALVAIGGGATASSDEPRRTDASQAEAPLVYATLSFEDSAHGIAARATRDEPRIDPVRAAVAELLAKPDLAEAAGDNRIAAAIAGFYADRSHAPLWVTEGRLTPEARSVIDRIARADEDGLDPSRYDLPSRRLGVPRPVAADRLADAELKLSLAAVAYARDARGGLAEPSRLGRNVTAKPVRPNASEVLKGAAGSEDAAAFLEGFNPQHPAFVALSDKLRTLRAADEPPRLKRIAPGPLLRPGSRDERVPDLRERFGLETADGADAELYDRALAEAVRAFQERSSLVVDGVVGPATLQALNSARDVTVADVLVNMERWRWLPPDMGGAHYVWVNVPEFRLRVVSDGETTFETRVIVGMADRQTPIFSDEIEYLEVNPYWHVPQSIAARDLLPDLQRDPLSLYRRGIQVFYTGDGNAREIDPRLVDWHAWSGRSLPFHFRQVPSEVNALGKVKFMFPNEHAVYLHDTPTRNLFSRSVRMFSSGCVRVEHPVDFADALLSLEADLDGARVERLIAGGRNGTARLKRYVPVHLTYFTVWVDDTGEVQLRDDVYGHDEKLKSMLGLADAEST